MFRMSCFGTVTRQCHGGLLCRSLCMALGVAVVRCVVQLAPLGLPGACRTITAKISVSPLTLTCVMGSTAIASSAATGSCTAARISALLAAWTEALHVSRLAAAVTSTLRRPVGLGGKGNHT